MEKTIGIDGEVLMSEHVFDLQPIYDREDPLKQSTSSFRSQREFGKEN